MHFYAVVHQKSLMPKPKYTALLLALSLIVLFLALSPKPQSSKESARFAGPEEADSASDRHLRAKRSTKGSAAQKFAEKMGFNSQFCFLIDMSIPSSQKRFFIYDMQGDSLLKSGLVTHGRCNEKWLEGRRYSNVVGSGCTSLGKYRIGIPYKGRFGQAYKLHGLEASNSAAFERFVVLHGQDCVPSVATGDEICQSDGCPTVAPEFLKVLGPSIRKSRQPVLLWIFE